MRVRLRDVADLAGVSEATVSRVVNGKPGVNASTRKAVLQVLAEMGYEAPGLSRLARAGLVGLMVPELDNPIFPAFAQAIETRLSRHGYTSVLCTATQDGVQEQEYVDMLGERNVAGIVVVSGLNADTTADHSLYRKLLHHGVPMVFVNGFMDDVEAPFISADDRFAADLAVRHLASLGHRRIACLVGPHRYRPVQRKVDGYLAALRAVDPAAEPLVVEQHFSAEGGHVGGTELLERGVTAIVTAGDLMALGAVRAAHERGLSVPGEVSVVGYDDTPLMAYTDPPMTTIRQPVRTMSDAAVRALLEQIAGRPPRGHEYLFRPELVVRRSTGPLGTAQWAAG